MYEINLEQEAEDELYQIPFPEKILIRIKSYLIQSPQELGKRLTGKHKGQYRYRYGDYRVIYEIDQKNKIVTVVRVGHRREVY